MCAHTKRIFQSHRMEQEVDDFFENPYVEFDVRVRARIDLLKMENLIDPKSALKHLKKDLRAMMLKEFRKELSKQIKEQL